MLTMVQQYSACSLFETAVYEQWFEFIDQAPREFQFLKSFTPVFEAMTQRLLEHIKDVSLIDLATLKSSVYQHNALTVYQMVVRVCVLEMHDAKENGYLTDETSEKRFDQFIALLSSTDNMQAIFEKYPVLDKQLAILIENYTEAMQRFFTFLSEDEKTLQNHFSLGHKITHIERAGDNHRRGQAVIILTFDNDEKLVFKPHSLAVDCAYNHFIDWFNQHSDLDLKAAKAVNFDSHGWCEFIQVNPCTDKTGLDLFYTRLGAMLAVTYMLNGTDLHFENLLACGAYPVIIDLECLTPPAIRQNVPGHLQEFRKLVTASLILPMQVHIEDEEESYDISAFAGSGGQLLPEEGLVAEHAGLDTMRIIRAKGKTEDQQNIPVVDGKKIDVLDYREPFEKGFDQAYRCLLSYQKLLLSDASPLRLFENVEVRFVPRPSMEYARLLLESYHPSLYHEPEKHAEHFEWLVSSKEDEKMMDYRLQIASEKADLAALDIPLFVHWTGEKMLLDSQDNKLDNYVTRTGFDDLQAKVNLLSEADLAIQHCVINQAFGAHALAIAAEIPHKHPSIDFADLRKIDVDRVATQRAAAKRAGDIFEHILKYKIEDNSNFTWPHLRAVKKGSWIPSVTDPGLYEGLLGLMLVAGHLVKTEGQEQFASFVDGCLNQVRRFFDAISDNMATGAYSGLGGLLFALCELDRIGFNLRSEIDQVLIIFDQNFDLESEHADIIDGPAGYLVSLLACQEHVSNEILARQGRQCVEHVLMHYPDPSTRPEENIHLRFKGDTIIGVAHGTSGFLWALGKFNLLFPNEEVTQWVEKALEFERDNFSIEKGCWPDCVSDKPDKEITYNNSWCYGSVGIGLSRFDLQQAGFNDQFIQGEIAAAVNHVLSTGLLGSLNLCHGDMGSLDFLQALGKHSLIDDQLIDCAFQEYVLPQTEDIESICPERVGNVFVPSIMTGLCGISYQLLRYANPGKISSLLAFGCRE